MTQALLDEIERLYEVQDGILGFIGLPTFEDLMRLARAGLRVPALEGDVERLRKALENIRTFHPLEFGAAIAGAALNPKDPAHASDG